MDSTVKPEPPAVEAFKLGTKIYELAFQSDIPALTALLESADKKVLDHHDNVDGTTILMVAARDGNFTVVHSLLALGPEKLDRHIRDRTGWTALHWAACGATDNGGSGLRPNQTGEVVRLLLNSGLRDDVRGSDDETPVDVALKMLNAPALMVFSEWAAAHGGRGVGVRIGAVGNGYAGARYTDRRNSTSTPAITPAGVASALASSPHTTSAGDVTAPASSSSSTAATTSAGDIPAPASSSLSTPTAASAGGVPAPASSAMSTPATVSARYPSARGSSAAAAARYFFPPSPSTLSSSSPPETLKARLSEYRARRPSREATALTPPTNTSPTPPTTKATTKAEKKPQFPW